MTKRLPVSTIQNRWSDAQRVDLDDMTTEQEHSDSNDAAIVNNFFGSGILLENPGQPVIFDSDSLTEEQAALLPAFNFDGTGLAAHLQPSDTQLGNQLTVELTDSALEGPAAAGRLAPNDNNTIPLQASAYGRLSTKVLIIGLSFDNTLQYDRFYFYRKEKQTTSKHYKRILAIFTQDFLGNNNCSRALGGRIIITEAMPFELSRDANVVAQDVMPDLFFRDFKVADSQKGLFPTIQEAIGQEYNLDTLQIQVTGKQPKSELASGDVTTRIGQKFKITSDNIQKVTLLLGINEDTEADIEDKFDWSGDLVVSIHALQTNVDCPLDIQPDLDIEFEPEDIPLMEKTYSQAELRSLGYVLTNIAQPIDFIFTNSKVSRAKALTIGNYYAVVIRRTGDASVGTLFAEVGTDRLDDSRLTLFNSTWVDSTTEDMWFQVWSDAAKVADGQGYDYGTGIAYDKTAIESTTGAQIDNEIGPFSFVNTGSFTQNNAILQASVNETVTTQDERTGNNIFSRKQSVPSFSFLTNGDLETLKETQNPFLIGCMADQNPKDINDIEGTQQYIGLAQDDLYIIINPGADLLSRQLVGRKLIPQIECSSYEYKIYDVKLCTDGYGDINGDGEIDSEDVLRASQLIGESLTDTVTQQKIVDGYFTTLELLRADVDGDGTVSDADVTLIEQFIAKEIVTFPAGSSFTHLELRVQSAVGRYDGYHDCDGYIRLDGYCFEGDRIDPDTLEGTEEQIAAQKDYYGNQGNPSINTDNPSFSAVPFGSLNYLIQYQDFWQDYLIALNSDAKVLPQSFFFEDSSTFSDNCNNQSPFVCEDRVVNPIECDPGRNDFYVPDNLIIGEGQIIRPDGSPLKTDIEIGTIILQLPESPFNESSIDVFRKFVVDKGDGFTQANYPAMKYFDCTTVKEGDIEKNRLRFNVSIQSFSPNLDGYDAIDGYGVIVDDIIGIYMDNQRGILRLTAKDLLVDQLLKTLTTRIQIIVYLKKGGFNNDVLVVDPSEVVGLSTTPSESNTLNGFSAGIGSIFEVSGGLMQYKSFGLYDYQEGVNFDINDATFLFLQEAANQGSQIEILDGIFTGSYTITGFTIQNGIPELIVDGLDAVTFTASERYSWRIANA